MSGPLILAVPSKGRLEENARAFFARAGLRLVRGRGVRDYRGAIEGIDGAEVAYLSAAEIAREIAPTAQPRLAKFSKATPQSSFV